MFNSIRMNKFIFKKKKVLNQKLKINHKTHLIPINNISNRIAPTQFRQRGISILSLLVINTQIVSIHIGFIHHIRNFQTKSSKLTNINFQTNQYQIPNLDFFFFFSSSLLFFFSSSFLFSKALTIKAKNEIFFLLT